jgi:hypothetical protein
MGLFNALNLSGNPTAVDWEMTPEYSFGTFESWLVEKEFAAAMSGSIILLLMLGVKHLSSV